MPKDSEALSGFAGHGLLQHSPGMGFGSKGRGVPRITLVVLVLIHLQEENSTVSVGPRRCNELGGGRSTGTEVCVM